MKPSLIIMFGMCLTFDNVYIYINVNISIQIESE